MGDVTQLIDAASRGDAAATHALFARVYDELKWIARRRMAGASSPTLDTTGLVHETYLKLAIPAARDVQGRAHFFALAARAMRQIVIDHTRARAAEKRGGTGLQMVELDGVGDMDMPQAASDELLDLDEALTRLEADAPDLARLVELRYFAGLSIEEIAAMQSVSERTLARQWRTAKAFLYEALHPDQ